MSAHQSAASSGAHIDDEQLDASHYEATRVWIPGPSEAQPFVLAELVRAGRDDDDGAVTVRLGTDERVVPQADVLPAASKECDDLVQMDAVNQATILDTVSQRFARHTIYTKLADILIALNPYQWLDELYNEEALQGYARMAPQGLDMPPHIFQVADRAYRGLVEERRNQAIVISGESGAGKTETTKKCLQYLTHVALQSRDAVSGTDGAALQTRERRASDLHREGIEEKILSANPILEAFGNARTNRNNNSSRFGKWMAIHIDHRGMILGSDTTNYLLEKSRVVFQAAGERNFHVLYGVTAALGPGAPATLRRRGEALGITSAAEYNYLNQSGTFDVPGVDDSDLHFVQVENAFQNLGFTPEEQAQVWEVIAATLSLGNVIFEPTREGEGSGVTRGAMDALSRVAGLLGVDADALQRALTYTTLRVRGRSSMSSIPLAPDKAAYARDSLAKALFGKLFDWLVESINALVAMQDERRVAAHSTIGILDIFGFESFEHNSFEQLCINYCNEKLQQHFINFVFKMETEVYRQEGINYTQVRFEDNQDILDLLEKKPHGLFPLLDEEIVVPRGSDEGFYQKLCKRAGNAGGSGGDVPGGVSKRLEKSRGVYRKGTSTFTLRHFAGDVAYAPEDFLAKNRDALSGDCEGLMKLAEKDLVKAIFAQDDVDGLSPPLDSSPYPSSPRQSEGGGVRKRRSTRRSTYRGSHLRQNSGLGMRAVKTLSKEFVAQLNTLMMQLHSSDPHFVRCIKPNADKSPSLFDNRLVLQQLAYAGVIDAVEVRKSGFPFRRDHASFFSRYLMLVPTAAEKRKLAELKGATPKKQCEELLRVINSSEVQGSSNAFGADPDGKGDEGSLSRVQIGKTRCFYRTEVHRALEHKRGEMAARAATKIQALHRGHQGRIRYHKLWLEREKLRLAVRLQKRVRGIKGRARAARRAEALTALRGAMAERQLSALSEMLAAAHTCDGGRKLELPIVREATKLEERLKREAELLKQLQRLSGDAVDAIEQYDELAAACDEANELDMSTLAGAVAAQALSTASTKREKVRERMETKATLVRAAREGQKEELQAALALARSRKAQWGTLCDSEAEQAEKALLHIAAEEDGPVVVLRKALSRGAAAGSVGELDFGSLSTDELESAIGVAAAFKGAAHGKGIITPEGKQLFATAQKIAPLRAALRKRDWDTVKRLVDDQALSDERIAPEARDEVAAARDEWSNREILEQLTNALADGGASGSVGAVKNSTIKLELLDKGLAHAEEAGIKTAVARRIVSVATAIRALRQAMLEGGYGSGGAVAQALATLKAPIGGSGDNASVDELQKLGCEAALAEVQLAEQEQEYTTHLEELRNVLSTGGAHRRGGVGQRAFSEADPRPITVAMAQASASGYCDSKGQSGANSLYRLYQAAGMLQQLRTAQKTLADAGDSTQGQADAWNSIKEAVNAAEQLSADGTWPHNDPVHEKCWPEVEAAIADVHERDTIEALNTGILEGAICGAVGVIDISGVDIEGLAARLQQANTRGVETKEGQLLLNTATTVLKLRTAISSDLWDDAALELDRIDGKGESSGGGTVEMSPLATTEIALIRDEVHDRRVIEELTTALQPEMAADADSLRQAIMRAELATAEVRSERAEALLTVAKALEGLRSALVARDWEALERCLGEIKEQGCPPAIAEEVEAAQATFDDHEVVKALAEALSQGMAGGSVGAYDVSEVRIEALQAAISFAIDKGCRSANATRLLMTARVILRLRNAITDNAWADVGDLVEERWSRVLMLLEDSTKAEQAQAQAAAAAADALAHKPGPKAVRVVGVSDVTPVPDHRKSESESWTETTDPDSGRKYYFNTRTRRASWAANDGSRRRSSLVASSTAAAQTDMRKGGAASSVRAEGIGEELESSGGRPLGGDELSLAAAELKDRTMCNSFIDALSAGGAQGEPGRLNVVHIDHSRLEHVVGDARARGCASARSAHLLRMAALVRDLRVALKAERWDDVDDPLERAEQLLDEAQNEGSTNGTRVRSRSRGGRTRSRGISLSGSSRVAGAAGADLSCVADELKLCRQDVQIRVVWRKVTDALANGMASGSIGELNLSTLQTDVLEMAISEAALLVVKTAESEALITSARVVLRVRLALRARNWERAASVLPPPAEVSKLLPVVHDELRMMQAEINNTKMCKLLSEGINSGAAATAGVSAAKGVNEVADVGVDDELLDVRTVRTEALAAALAFVEQAGPPRASHTSLLAHTADVLLQLREAQRAGEWDRVASVIDGALPRDANDAPPRASRQRAVVDEAVAELDRARTHCDDRRVRAALLDALRSGTAGGKVGILDTSQVTTEALEDAIELAERFGCQSQGTKRLLLTAERIEQLRGALLQDDWTEVQHLLDDIDGVGAEDTENEGASAESLDDVVLEELALIRAEAHDRRMLNDLTKALQSGGATHIAPLGEIHGDGLTDAGMADQLDTHSLEQAMTRARATSDRRRSKAVNSMLTHVEHVHALRKAQRAGDTATVRELAEKHDLDELPEATRAEIVRARVEANDKVLRDHLLHAITTGKVVLAADATAPAASKVDDGEQDSVSKDQTSDTETLVSVIDAQDVEIATLQTAIARVSKQHVEDASSVSAKTLVHLRSAQLLLQLRAAIRQQPSPDWERAHQLVSTIQAGGVAPAAAPEVELIRVVAGDERMASVIRTALSTGFATGDVGFLRINTVRLDHLDAAISEAAAVAARHATGMAAVDGGSGQSTEGSNLSAGAVAQIHKAITEADAAVSSRGGGTHLLRAARLVRRLRAAQRAGEFDEIDGIVHGHDGTSKSTKRRGNRSDVLEALSAEVRKEVARALQDAQLRGTLKRLSTALSSGRAQGTVGQYDLVSIDTTALQIEIDACQKQVDAEARNASTAPIAVKDQDDGGDKDDSGAGVTAGILRVARLMQTLRRSWKLQKWDQLGAAIDALRALKYHAALPAVVEEMSIAGRELADVRATSALRQALRSGAMGGSVGAVKLSTIEVADLDSAIALAESAEPIAAQSRRMSTRTKASNSQVREDDTVPADVEAKPTFATEYAEDTVPRHQSPRCRGLLAVARIVRKLRSALEDHRWNDDIVEGKTDDGDDTAKSSPSADHISVRTALDQLELLRMQLGADQALRAVEMEMAMARSEMESVELSAQLEAAISSGGASWTADGHLDTESIQIGQLDRAIAAAKARQRELAQTVGRAPIAKRVTRDEFGGGRLVADEKGAANAKAAASEEQAEREDSGAGRLSERTIMLLRTAKLLRGVRAAVRAEEWAVVRRLLASWKSTASGDAESEPVQEPDSAEQDSDELWPGLAESARKEVSSAATAARSDLMYSGIANALKQGAIKVATESADLVDTSLIDADGLRRATQVAEQQPLRTVEVDELLGTARVLASVRGHVKRLDWASAERALALLLRAEEKGELIIAEEAQEELTAARHVVHSRLVSRTLLAALSSGAARGDLGKMEVSSIETEQLRVAIATAARLGCWSPEATQLLRTAKVVLQLREALQERKWEAVHAALEAATTVGSTGSDSSANAGADATDAENVPKGLHAVARQELKNAEDEFTDRFICSELSAALERGGATGAIKSIDVSGISVESIDTALEIAQKLNCQTEEGVRLVRSCRVVRQLRLALAGTVENSRAWDRVKDVLDKADQLDLADAAKRELSHARDEVHDAEVLRILLHQLRAPGAKVPTQPKDGPSRKGSTAQRDARNAARKRSRAGQGPTVAGADWAGAEAAQARCDALGAAIERADELGCKTQESQRLLRSTADILKVRLALLDHDWERAQDILASIDFAETSEDAIPELETISDELDNAVATDKLTQALQNGMARGDVGSLDTSAVQTLPLRSAIGFAVQRGVGSHTALQLLRTAEIVTGVREAMVEQDWPRVHEHLLTAPTISIAPKISGGDDDNDDRTPVQVGPDPIARAELEAANKHWEDWHVRDELIHALSVPHDAAERELGREAISLAARDNNVAHAHDLQAGGHTLALGLTQLDAAIELAQALGCHTPDARRLLRTATRARRSRVAAAENSWEECDQALSDYTAEDLQPQHGALEAVCREHAMLARVSADAQTVAALRTALTRGQATHSPDTGDMDTSTVDTSVLERTIEAAKLADQQACSIIERDGVETSLLPRSDVAGTMLLTAEMVLPLRRALAENDWTLIEALATDIDLLAISDVAVDEVQAVLDECDDRVIVREIGEALAKAGADGSGQMDSTVLMGALTGVVAHARQLRCSSEGAKALLQMSDTMRGLRLALAERRWASVADAVRTSRENGDNMVAAVIRRFPGTEEGFVPHWRHTIDDAASRLETVSATRIQCTFRGANVRHNQAARRIQSGWRWHKAQTGIASMVFAFMRAKRATVQVQSAMRMKPMRRQFSRKQQAATSVAKYARAASARQKVRSQRSARALQSSFRGFTVRNDLAKKNAAATQIQRHWRAMGKQSEFLAAKKAAVRLQGGTRGRLARVAMLQMMLLRGLREGEADGDTDALEKAAKYAARVNPQDKGMQKLVQTGALVKDVRSAKRSGDMNAMASAMAAVSSSGVAEVAARELIATLDAVEFDMVPAQLSAALTKGGVAVGVDGEMDLSDTETSELGRVVDEVRAVAPSDARCKLLLESADLVLTLRGALLRGHWDDVMQKLEEAGQKALAPEAETEIATVRGLMRLRVLRRSLEKALREGRLQESSGFPDVSSVKLVALDEALRGAEQLRTETEAAVEAGDAVTAGNVYDRVATLATSAQLVYDLRAALAQSDVRKARALLADADVPSLAEAAASEVATAQATIQRETEAQEALEALAEARASADLSAVERALATAGRLRLAEHPNPRFADTLRSARAQVRALEQVQRNLREGVATADLTALDAATAEAEAQGVRGSTLHQAQQLTRELRSLGERVANACKALDTEQLKLLLAEARALNHTLPNDSEVRGLLMMPEANLLLLKLERFHDGVLPPTVNVAEASQRLMQIQYEEDKTQFTFANFPGFSDLARRAQDLGRLDHSTMAGSKLGFAITKAAGTARGGAIFEHIRSYVHKSVDYVTQVVDLLGSAHESAVERDEVYAQLIVLLRNGEDLNQMTRAWQLMSLFLSCCPPSETMMNHLDTFLREEEEDTCLSELHRVLYASQPALPTVQDIRMMESKKFYSSKCIARMYSVA